MIVVRFDVKSSEAISLVETHERNLRIESWAVHSVAFGHRYER